MHLECQRQRICNWLSELDLGLNGKLAKAVLCSPFSVHFGKVILSGVAEIHIAKTVSEACLPLLPAVTASLLLASGPGEATA
jgi:hypothetical protein